MLGAVHYGRVSDVSQVENYSLDAQERLYNELCRTRGWEPVRLYREEGKSARTDTIARRPVFRQLLEDAAQGEFDVVVVHTLDRWARSMKVFVESIAILDKHNVALVSITENLDWTTPEGRLVARTLASFNEFFSDKLSSHTKKGVDERAHQGRHLGGIPFGYASCYRKDRGERHLDCDPEHPGGVHIVPEETPAIVEMFQRYSAGTNTTAQEAKRLNDAGFRSRKGRHFTSDSVKVLLHNPFYTGKVKHHDQLLPGAHEPIVSEELFETVQEVMRKNSGRSRTLKIRSRGEYTLKGIARCIHCGLALQSEPSGNGRSYYREPRGSRGHGKCIERGGSVRCDVIDAQMNRIMAAISLPAWWRDQLWRRVELDREVQRVEQERKSAQQKLNRLAQLLLDGDIDEAWHQRQKQELKEALNSPEVPQARVSTRAKELLENVDRLWSEATLGERNRLLMSMLEAVYLDTQEGKDIVALQPKPVFRKLFQAATRREGSGVKVLSSEGEAAAGVAWKGGNREAIPDPQ